MVGEGGFASSERLMEEVCFALELGSALSSSIIELEPNVVRLFSSSLFFDFFEEEPPNQPFFSFLGCGVAAVDGFTVGSSSGPVSSLLACDESE